eukprot:1173930-Alexandrium_andersonii.AAC.1
MLKPATVPCGCNNFAVLQQPRPLAKDRQEHAVQLPLEGFPVALRSPEQATSSEDARLQACNW